MKPSKHETCPVRTRNLWSYCWILLTAVAVVGCAGTMPSGTREAGRREVESGLDRYAPAAGTAPVPR